MSSDISNHWAHVTEEEESLLREVDGDELMTNTAAIAQWTRLSGSADEAAAAEYVKAQMEAYGLTARIVHHVAYISLPVSARLVVQTGHTAPALNDITCITHSCGVSTPPAGLAGELIYLGAGTTDDYAKADVRGKIVLLDGLAGPEPTKVAEAHGAIGHIHINDANLHEMTISPVWGSPEAWQIDLLPRTPAISVTEAVGAALIELTKAGPVNVQMHTEVDTGWRQIPLVLGELPACTERPRYVLLSGHLDSWHKGAMDNGSANATMLEVARVMATHRSSLRRGLRIAFWSGHSHGRYAGSAWYADNHWTDLHRNCVAHVNVDSTGAIGASILGEANVMAELSDLAAGCVRAVVPDEEFTGTRFGRAGDQSFWGHGVPSIFMSLSQQPADTGTTAESFRAIIGTGAQRSGGLGWWWHSVHDTIDKIDKANLIRDTKVYVLAVARLCCSPVLPLDYRRTCDELRQAIRAIARACPGPTVELDPLLGELAGLQIALEKTTLVLARLAWQSEITKSPRAEKSLAAGLASANELIMDLGRLLIPANYVGGSRFGQDPALPTRPLPALAAAAAAYATADAETPAAHSAAITFVRARARIENALQEARLVAEKWLELNEPRR